MHIKIAAKKLVSAAFILALASVVGLGVFSFEAARRTIAADEQRSEGRRLLISLERLFVCMLDAETGQRGFLLTGERAYLEPYTAARDAFPKRLAEVRNRIATAGGSSVHFEALEPLLHAKMAELEETVRSSQTDPSAALAIIKTNRGKQAMDEIRQAISRLETRTLVTLETQANDAHANLRTALISLTAGGITAVVVLLLAYGLLRREMDAREKLNCELEDRVKERTEDLRVTLESIGDAVLATDTTGIVTLMNKEAERLTGWTAYEALRQPLENVFSIVNEETRRPAENPIVRSLREGVVTGLANHTVLVARDGAERPIEDSAAPIRLENGNIRGVILVFRDVSQDREARRKIESSEAELRLLVEKLRDSELRFSRILSSAMDAIITVDSRQRVVFFNPAAEQVFGCPAAEAIGGPLDRFIPVRFRQEHSKHIERFGHTGTTGRRMGALGQISGLRANGQEFPIEASISHVEVGGEQYFTVIVRDITKRKRAEDDLNATKVAVEAASRAKDDFLAALSHELRTPLTPVLLLADTLEQASGLPERLRADFALIRKNVKLEARLIDDLLDLTRIAHGKLRLDFENTDVHAILRQTLDLLQDELHAKQHVLTVELSAPEHLVRGDVVRLQQVFWNVIKNAVKFTPAHGRISIRSSAAAQRDCSSRNVHIEVSDTGPGILPQDLSRIFDAFSQGEKADSHRFGGLGLGLSITRAIVEKHGGRIWADSAGSGQGATFHIELPLTESQAVPPAAKAVPHPRVPLRLRILLVEDNEPTRDTLERLLKRRGYEVLPAGTLAEARELAEKQDFDLIVSDLGLPDGNGCDLMREVHRDHGTPGIALSGYGMDEDIRRSHECGFTEHITKPVEMSTLDRAIAQVQTTNRHATDI